MSKKVIALVFNGKESRFSGGPDGKEEERLFTGVILSSLGEVDADSFIDFNGNAEVQEKLFGAMGGNGFKSDLGQIAINEGKLSFSRTHCPNNDGQERTENYVLDRQRNSNTWIGRISNRVEKGDGVAIWMKIVTVFEDSDISGLIEKYQTNSVEEPHKV